MKPKEIIDFVSNIYAKDDEEIKNFCINFNKEYPKMSQKDKKNLDKHWDLMEKLHMYLNYYQF